MSVPPTGRSEAILQTVERYYTDRLREFGATARGVDWNSAESQVLRFDQLLQVVDAAAPAAALLDVGCGYGALLDTVRQRGLDLDYRGFDISHDMVAAARASHGHDSRAAFTTDPAALRPATYAVASGIFNVKLHHDEADWHDYVWAAIASLHQAGSRGFAFNMLSTYSDPERRRDTLYYADPLEVFDRCKRQFSPRVALLHDYPLFEFTIVVRK
ncbi:MAG: class I SAM-dependent methyltransferase [Acidobacteria bacterium]|nr:class I SAM-dependent methyltransferase [Acidobacteriota bacterium]